MSFTGTLTVGVSLAGKSYNGRETATDETVLLLDALPLIPAAEPATLTTRTSSTAGVLTMTNGGHGIQVGDKIDLYFDGGVIASAAVTAVTGTAVTFSGGITVFNKTLPALPTIGATPPPITVGKCVEKDYSLIGDTIQLLAWSIDAGIESVFNFLDASEASLWCPHLNPTQGAGYWSASAYWANPLATKVTAKVRLSHADTAAPRAMQVGSLLNS